MVERQLISFDNELPPAEEDSTVVSGPYISKAV